MHNLSYKSKYPTLVKRKGIERIDCKYWVRLDAGKRNYVYLANAEDHNDGFQLFYRTPSHRCWSISKLLNYKECCTKNQARNYTQVQENDRSEWLRNDLQKHWEDIFVSFKQYSHKNTKTANVSTMSWPSHLNICSVSNWTNVKSSDLPFLSGEIVPTLWSCFEIQIRSYIDAQKHSSYIMLHKYRVMQ